VPMGLGATVRGLLAAGAVVVLAAGCGSESDPSPPAGVDELVIPTPSPDPDDYVATIDNPWLPYAVGARWTYTDGTVDVTFTAEEGPTIAGVATTAVTADQASGSSADYFAQDTDGNVWWFGREGEWRAGEDGAEAGIAMLDKPRVGDGYAEMGSDGEAGQRSVIKELVDELVIETTTTEGQVVVRHYERGTGLVLSEVGETELELVAYDEPQS
jgi:hypothetical protein